MEFYFWLCWVFIALRAGFSLAVASEGYFPIVVWGFLPVKASPFAEQRLQGMVQELRYAGSVVVAHGI